MNTSWKTTIGGAFSATGTALMGIGVVPQLGSNVHSTILTNVAMAGFIFSAIGTFLSHLFAADADAVKTAIAGVQAQVATNTTDIATKTDKP